MVGMVYLNFSLLSVDEPWPLEVSKTCMIKTGQQCLKVDESHHW